VKNKKITFILLPILCFLIAACSTQYTITIKSDPRDVLVTDMSRGMLGNTDLETIVVKEFNGNHPTLNLTFSKPGYVEEKKDFLKIKNNQTIMVTLHSAPTYIYVESIPPSATIKIFNTAGEQLQFSDSSKISKEKYFANSRLKVSSKLNKVQLELKHLGYKTLNKEITIEPHKENRFSFQMEKISQVLRIASDPNGAEVHERTLGFLGRTPLNRSLNWDQLIRLSQQYDAMNTSSVNFQLQIKKQHYKSKELIREFSLYDTNPIIRVNLQQSPTN